MPETAKNEAKEWKQKVPKSIYAALALGAMAGAGHYHMTRPDGMKHLFNEISKTKGAKEKYKKLQPFLKTVFKTTLPLGTIAALTTPRQSIQVTRNIYGDKPPAYSEIVQSAKAKAEHGQK